MGFCKAFSLEPFFPFLPLSSLPPLPAPLGFESEEPPLTGIGDGDSVESPLLSAVLLSFFAFSSTPRLSLSPVDLSVLSFRRAEPDVGAPGSTDEPCFPDDWSAVLRRDSAPFSTSFSSALSFCSFCCSGSSFSSPGGGFSRDRMELEEKVRGENGRERETRAETKAERKCALYLEEASNGRTAKEREVWWSAARQGRVWPRSMLLYVCRVTGANR